MVTKIRSSDGYRILCNNTTTQGSMTIHFVDFNLYDILSSIVMKQLADRQTLNQDTVINKFFILVAFGKIRYIICLPEVHTSIHCGNYDIDEESIVGEKDWFRVNYIEPMKEVL